MLCCIAQLEVRSEGTFVMGQLVSTPDSPKSFALPIGAASPLWLAFVGAASAGVAYWWMTRWARSPRVTTGPSVALAAPVEAAAVVVEALEREAVEAPISIAEPPAPAEIVAAAEPPPPPAPVEAPVIKKTAAKAPKPEAAPTPAVAKTALKPKPVKAPKVAAPKAAAEPASPKPAARKPTIKRPVKTA